MAKGLHPLCLLVLLMLSSAGTAQTWRSLRGCCTPDLLNSDTRGASPRRLPKPNTQWDATKTYRQLVLLMSFSDTDFLSQDPRASYDSIFNYPGYNKGLGPGCVADYFREQSGGLFNLQFDVYGPFRIGSKAQPYSHPTSETMNDGRSQISTVVKQLLESQAVADFSVYDWDNNGYVNQVIIVYAGYGGNQDDQVCYGHIWPNTGNINPVVTPSGKNIYRFTASAELWSNNSPCGIGTVCHEYSHSLGLPDIYPTNGWAYSTVDEWDLMDGGNFTNWGWCPPNYSPLEKMLLGWLTPVELTDPQSVSNLKPVAEGGCAYKVSHSSNEYLLLENRQQRGWDAGLPGRGLVVYHVNYDASKWNANTVNNVTNKFYYSIIHADGLSYSDWERLLIQRGIGLGMRKYQNPACMNSYLLSSSPYPWTTDSTQTVNNELTDDSTPASVMYGGNLSKPISNIRMNGEGLVSFEFMGGQSVQVSTPVDDMTLPAARTFDLLGRRVGVQPYPKRGTIVVGKDRKIIKRK